MVTNKNGYFILNGLCNGQYDVQISYIGFETIEEHIHVKHSVERRFTLARNTTSLTEVIVQNKLQPTNSTSVLQGRTLDASRGTSLAESLKQITGVSILQTGSNIYKPVIHGLHSNRILILNNGIRQEGQQWGSEHAPEIDPFIANRLTVIKGSGALQYGGDAIGGVILVEQKNLPASKGLTGEIQSGLFSNNRMGTLSISMEDRSQKHPAIAWRLQASAKKAGTAKTPDYWLENSAMEEWNFSGTAGWKKDNKGVEIYYSQFNTKLGIFSGSHIGNTTDLLNAISSKEPPDYIRNAPFSYEINRPYQQVSHQLLKIKAYKHYKNVGRLTGSLAGQYNHRREYDKKRFQNSPDGPQLDLQLGTLSGELIYDHYDWKGWNGTIGLNGSYQNNSYQYRLFIPNYQAINAGLFLTEKKETKHFIWDLGVRFDQRSFFHTKRNNGKPYPDRNYASVSASAGLTIKINEKQRINLNSSTTWRAPQVNELYSDGLHHGAARIERGDSLLVPERANNLTLSWQFSNSRWNIELGTYLRSIKNFIYLNPSYPPQLTIRGAFPAFVYTQTDALLYGADLNISYKWNAHLTNRFRSTILYARNQQSKDWIIQMPPNKYELESEWNFTDGIKRKNSYAKLILQRTEMQNRIPGTGNIELKNPDGTISMAADYAPPPEGYFLIAVETGLTYNVGGTPWSFILSCQNLLNQRYRDYMNAFRYFSDETGRNIQLRIKIPFVNHLNHYKN